MKWEQTLFAERFESRLLAREKSLKDFASDVGINYSTLGNYKRISEPDLDSLMVISDGLDVRPEWLVFGSEFEPMDDEELELVEDWRKLNAAERHGFSAVIHAVVQDREERLKPAGKRTKRAAAPKQSDVPPDLAKELQEAVNQMALLISTLDPASLAKTPAASLATLLDRLAARATSLQPTASPASDAATAASGAAAAGKTG